MLIKLLRTYLRPHRGLIVGVIFFQLLQSGASLWLPTLNADIINNGVTKGDTAYINFDFQLQRAAGGADEHLSSRPRAEAA